MSEKANKLGVELRDYSPGEGLPQVIGGLGHLSLEERQWEQDRSRLGDDEATRLYVKGLALTAEQLQRFPQEEALAMRGNVATLLLRGESLDPLFPGHEAITSGCEEFLAGCLREELRLAEQVQLYRTLAELKPELLLDQLTVGLPPDMHQRLKEEIMSLDDYDRSQFLRFCAGESPRWLEGEDCSVRSKYWIGKPGGDSNRRSKHGRDSNRKMLAYEEKLRLAGIDMRDCPQYGRLYPSADRASVFGKLPMSIEIINKEAPRLACRTSPAEFEEIIQSLSDRSSYDASRLLTVYNSTTLDQKGAKALRYNVSRVVVPYRGQFGELFALHRPRFRHRTRGKETPEVEDIIDRVLEDQKKYPGLNVEQEQELASLVDAGTWAEIRYAYLHPEECMLDDEMRAALEAYDASAGLLDISDCRLLAHIRTGHEALEKLLRHNRGVVFLVMRRKAEQLRTEQNLTDWLRLGLRALVRTIYKYDTSKERKLGTYFPSWVRTYANEAVAAEREMNRTQWDNVQRMRKAEADLLQILQREPTDEQIKKHLGWGQKLFDKIRAIIDAQRAECTVPLTESLASEDDFAEELAEYLDATDDDESLDAETVTNISAVFEEETLRQYNEMLGGDSIALDILILQFENGNDFKEIADILGLTEAEVSLRSRKALATIGRHLQAAGEDAHL